MTQRFASDEEAVRYMREVAVAGSGFGSWLGVNPVRCWDGEAELTLPVRPELTQHHGFVHGAIVGLMADNACAWAAASVAGDVVTGGYSISFLAPARGAKLRAKGVVAKVGRRQVIVRADVWSEDEGGSRPLVAIAQATIVPVG